MKFIRSIFLIFLILISILCLSFFVFFQTIDTSQYISQISGKASYALGRTVSIGHLGLGLSSRGITLDASPVLISDDPDFTSQPFIKIDRICLTVDLGSLVFHKKIQIKGISFQSPQIHIIRSQEGSFNFQSIAHPGQEVIHSSQDTIIDQPNMNKVQLIISPEVKKNMDREKFPMNITIKDASISFIDQNQNNPLDLWMKNINSDLTDVSFSQPFKFSLDACFYNEVSNVHLNALLFLDIPKRAFKFSDLKFNLDMSRIDFDQLKGVSPEGLDNSIFNKVSAGKVQINVTSLNAGIGSDPEAKGEINIAGVVIKNFNIIKKVMPQTIGGFAFQGFDLDKFLNGQLKNKLSPNDTIIENGHAQFTVHDKSLFIDDSLLQTNIIEIKAKGSINNGSEVDMQTILHFNTDVSAALVDQLEGLKYLLDDSQRIAIDASLKGKIPDLKYKPNKDFRKKSKKFLMEEGGNILGVFLGGGRSSKQGDTIKKHKSIFKDLLQ